MIFLKKYFQNRKGLQKLHMKHVPHSPNEKKNFFQKWVRTVWGLYQILEKKFIENPFDKKTIPRIICSGCPFLWPTCKIWHFSIPKNNFFISISLFIKLFIASDFWPHTGNRMSGFFPILPIFASYFKILEKEKSQKIREIKKLFLFFHSQKFIKS